MHSSKSQFAVQLKFLISNNFAWHDSKTFCLDTRQYNDNLLTTTTVVCCIKVLMHLVFIQVLVGRLVGWLRYTRRDEMIVISMMAEYDWYMIVRFSKSSSTVTWGIGWTGRNQRFSQIVSRNFFKEYSKILNSYRFSQRVFKDSLTESSKILSESLHRFSPRAFKDSLRESLREWESLTERKSILNFS